jgi:hypothetical protein
MPPAPVLDRKKKKQKMYFVCDKLTVVIIKITTIKYAAFDDRKNSM